MKLSASDIKALESLKRNQANLHKFRWVLLVLGFITILISMGPYTMYLITGSVGWATFIPDRATLYFASIAGSISTGYGIRGFKGDPQVKLLLRVINELRKDS